MYCVGNEHDLTTFQHIFVAGGTGNVPGTESSVEMLEFIGGGVELLSGVKWEPAGKLSTARCCSPQMGIVGTRLQVFGGESGPSDAVEVWDEEGRKWRENQGRVRSSMKFCVMSLGT